jgi:glycosyltransferase involved in cell wall biosynthesis
MTAQRSSNLSSSRQAVIGLVGVDPTSASFRLRLAPLIPHFEKAGLRAQVHALKGPEWWRVWRLAELWRSSDLLVFAKLKLLLGEIGFVARSCPTWVLDVDDAVMYRKPPSHGDPPGTASWRRRRFWRMVRHCRLVVTASQSLATTVEGHGPPVEVLPTPVSLASYPQAALVGNAPLKLAWIGLDANLRYLEDLAPVLRQLASEGLDFELCVICDRLPEMPGVTCRLVRWSERSEGADLAACDVGLAPLSDDAWTRGKGAYRCIQYAAAGLPTVASPVGANREVVADGETGLWATTAQQWRDALITLATDLSLRQSLGAAARERARRYDLAVIGPRYAEHLLRLLVERRRSPA